MAKKDDVAWSRSYILGVENKILQGLMASRTAEAVEAAVSYARFLKMAVLTS